jgi:hypothetical protein
LKPVRLTHHAQERCALRGTTEAEAVEAVRHGSREPAKKGRFLCRLNYAYGKTWDGTEYAVKQVAPVIAENEMEIVVVTVYTFFF